MLKGDLKTVSNDFARFLGLTVKRVENEIRSFFPLTKWLYGQEPKQPQAKPALPRQAASPSIASQNIPLAAVVATPIVKERPVPYDNKSEEIKSEFIFNDLQSSDKTIRTQAQQELKNIPQPLAIKLLERALAAEEDALRIIEGLNLLETLRDASPAARQLFKKYSGHQDSAVRLAALRSVAKYRDEESFNTVSAHLRDNDPEVRRRILNYLCWNFEERCLSFALAAFHDSDRHVRKAAVLIMGSLKAQEAITGLITLLSDPDKDVQESANSSLKKITGKDLGFNASASQEHKDEAVEEWNKWWRNNQARFGRPRHSVAVGSN